MAIKQGTLEWFILQKRLDQYMDKAIEQVAEKVVEKLNEMPTEKKEEEIETAVEQVEQQVLPTVQQPLIKMEEIFPLLSLSSDEQDKSKIIPFPYQQDALQKAFQEAVGTIVMPTGSGKTIVGAMIIKAFWQKNKAEGLESIRALVITPQITILNQWLDTFKKAGTPATAYYGEQKLLSELTVTTYQSASMNPEILKNFNGIIFDEVHHLYADEYSKLLEEEYISNKYFVIGLTATALQKGQPNYEIQEETLPVIYELTPTGLAEYGRAIIPKWISILITPSGRLDDAIGQLESTYKKIVAQFGSFYDMSQASKKRDRLALMGMKVFYYRQLLLSATNDKLLATVQAIQQELNVNPDSKIIVFTESGSSATFIGDTLTKIGISTLVLLSERGLSAQEKKEELEKFRKGYYKVLVGVNMIVEGLDIPEMDEAFMVSMSKKSERRFIQKLGRILRYREGKKPKIFTLTYRGTMEIDTMEELLSSTINKKEPDEIIRITPADIDLTKEFLRQYGVEISKDVALETVEEYLSRISRLTEY